MSSPAVPKRPRGRPRKNALPAGSDLPNSSRQPAGLRVTLRYNPEKKCLCKSSVQIAAYSCPHHGFYDNKSKGPPHKETGYTQSPNKRKWDEGNDEEQWDMFPEPPTTPKPQPLPRGNRISPRLLRTKYREVELCLLKNKVRNLAIEFAPDRYFGALPQPDREPLTELHFLDTPLEARKLIYRYLLVPSTKGIVFRSQCSSETFGHLNPELQTNILRANSQVYKECIPILYGENCFVARETSDFFFPTGITGLRRTTAQRIKHIMILRRCGATDCDITSQALAASLHNMVLQSPAFLSLRTVSIRFEVSRPAAVNVFLAQMHLQEHGVDANTVRAMYKKYPTVVDAAARVAYKALRKRSPFRELWLLEDSEYTVSEGGQHYIINASEVCLCRIKERSMEYQYEQKCLQEAIANMLLDEMKNEVQGAEGRWNWFKRHCPS